jgi:hypothetical protein
LAARHRESPSRPTFDYIRSKQRLSSTTLIMAGHKTRKWTLKNPSRRRTLTLTRQPSHWTRHWSNMPVGSHISLLIGAARILTRSRHVRESTQVLSVDNTYRWHNVHVHGSGSCVRWILGIYNRCELCRLIWSVRYKLTSISYRESGIWGGSGEEILLQNFRWRWSPLDGRRGGQLEHIANSVYINAVGMGTVWGGCTLKLLL